MRQTRTAATNRILRPLGRPSWLAFEGRFDILREPLQRRHAIDPRAANDNDRASAKAPLGPGLEIRIHARRVPVLLDGLGELLFVETKLTGEANQILLA
jgi:hypothetical protein